MNSKVNIIADDKGNVVRQSNSNSEFGHVRLVQTRVTFGNSGWVKKSNINQVKLLSKNSLKLSVLMTVIEI